jgi:hypothetical protein
MNIKNEGVEMYKLSNDAKKRMSNFRETIPFIGHLYNSGKTVISLFDAITASCSFNHVDATCTNV